MSMKKMYDMYDVLCLTMQQEQSNELWDECGVLMEQLIVCNKCFEMVGLSLKLHLFYTPAFPLSLCNQ